MSQTKRGFMYICICKGITEENVKNALKGSPKTQDVLKKLGVGDDCGTCLINVIERIQLGSKAK